MAGRTLGEAWVTIMPDTAKFRAALQAQVRKDMAGFKPTVTVTVNLRADSAKLRSELQTAVTAASKGLSATATVKSNLDNASVAKTKAALDAAAKDRTANIKTDTDAEKKAAQYTSWWDKALNQRILAERAASQKAGDAENLASKKAANNYTSWWNKALNQRVLDERKFAQKAADAERLAMKKATDAETLATKKATDSYVNWWTKALDQQELKSRMVTSDMRNSLGLLNVQIDKYKSKIAGMTVRTNDDQSKAELNVLQTRANVLQSTLGNITTNVGMAKALAQLATMNLAAAKFRSSMMAKNAMPELGLELSLAQSQFTHLEQNAHSLKKEIESALSPGSITIGTVTEKAKKDLRSLASGADAVLKEIDKIRMSGGVVTADDITKVKTLTSGLGQLSAAVTADGVTLKSTTGAYRGWVNTLISVSRGQIPLFNGALEKMLPHFLAVASGAHILVEAALEIVAVWVPAAMALTVFGIAAAKSSAEVYSGVKNMGIAASGTGQQFQGMAKKMGTSMSQIAKPYVFTAYGLALIALQKQSKTTATVIRTVGGTINRWMAEAVIAYQKGTGRMALQGASMFGILGDSFKQVGTIINGFIKITPGYAKDLLMLGDSILHIASALLNSGIAQGFGKIFLAAHGALFYLGLFATLGTKLGTVLLSPLARITGLSRALGLLGITASGTKGKLGNLISSVAAGWQAGTGKMIKAVDDMGFPLQAAMANTVEKSAKEAGTKFRTFGTIAGDAMSGLGATVKTTAKGIKGALGGMLSGLGVNPWLLGIAAIGAGLYFLISSFHSGSSAARDFGAAAATALGNSELQNFGTNMQLQIKAAQSGLAGAKSVVANYGSQLDSLKMQTGKAGANIGTLGEKINNTSQQMAGAQRAVGDWQAAVNGLNQKNRQFSSNLSLIAKTSGVDLPTALTMATHAGLTTKDMMATSAIAAQENALQVEGLIRGYSSLVNGVGGVNTAYQAMNIQSSQTMKNAQDVAGAFAGYTTLVTGGANAFDTFIQGQATLATNLGATGKAGGTATLRLGALRDVIKVTGANLDKLTPASVTANQAFLQQINNSQALYGSLLQLAAAAGNTKTAQHNLGAAGKDMIATLLKTAGGSKAARIQIYALAQTFGYTGKNTLPNLVKWLGSTGDRTKDLQVRMNGLTAGASNLAAASKALSGELNRQLSTALSRSIIDAEGGQVAFDKFAGAIRRFATKSSTANMEAVIKQGNNLKNVFIKSAGSAAAAEPVLQNYFQTLGIHNQAQAKAMADKILGIGGAASKISKPLSTSQGQFKDWASKLKISTDRASTLWGMLDKNNFNPLSGHVDANKRKFMDWASQVHISKGKAADLWNQLLNNKLSTVNSQVDGNKNKFINLMVKMGETKDAAKKLWDTLKKAPHVKATVAVGATTTGQVQAVAQASGAAKQVIGRMFFSANAHGMATGGKVPGWHNTGDNTLASSPGGPIALQGGEAIVPKNLSTHPEFTNFAKKKGIPGFASGGLVGTPALGNIGESYKNWRTNTANSSINFAGDAMKANVDGAYDALASAFTGTGGSAKGQAILAAAEKWNHHKYVFGGPSNPSTGWDCSSFAGYILGHDFHLPLPGGVPWSPNSHGPVSGAYAKEAGFSHVGNSESQIQAGDLLVFGTFSGPTGHVGFGVGPGQMFSAFSTSAGTIFSSATDAGRPPNIYRSGGAAGGGKVAAIKTGVPLIDKMAADAQGVYAQSAAIQSLFPKLGPAGGQPGTAKAGSMVQNGTAIFEYLKANLGMNPIAAAGAIASIWGESLFNPDAQGTGGRGLIGWTPAGTLPNSAFTGNATADLDAQLPLIVKFVRDNNDMGVINAMNSAGSVSGAANLWMRGVERAGKSDVHSEGLALAMQIMNSGGVATSKAQKTVLAHTARRHSTGGKIPGFARGGRVLNREIARLQKTHDRDAGKYHHFEALAAEMAREEHAKHITKSHLKSLKGREKRYLAEAAKYAGRIRTVDTQLAIDKSAKLGIPRPTNSVMKLAERLAVPPLINKYTAGSGSISPLGWALQPVLGDLLIAKHMAPKSWAGKPVINNQASSVMANWVAAVDTIGGFLNSQTGLKAAQLAGKATGIHGRQTEGPRKSFLTGGTIRENVLGVGPSGDTYKFHAGDKVTGPAIAATQGSQGGLTQEDRMLLIALVHETKRGNQIAASQGREFSRAINQNVARRIPR